MLGHLAVSRGDENFLITSIYHLPTVYISSTFTHSCRIHNLHTTLLHLKLQQISVYLLKGHTAGIYTHSGKLQVRNTFDCNSLARFVQGDWWTSKGAVTSSWNGQMLWKQKLIKAFITPSSLSTQSGQRQASFHMTKVGWFKSNRVDSWKFLNSKNPGITDYVQTMCTTQPLCMRKVTHSTLPAHKELVHIDTPG